MIQKYLVNPDETDQILNIYLETSYSAHHFIEKRFWDDNIEKVKNLLESSETYYYVKDGRIIGFISFLDIYMGALFIKYEFQNRGIGKELLDHAKETKEMIILNVYAKNEKATNFYLKNGFVITGEQIDEDTGEKVISMLFRKGEKYASRS